MARGRGAFPFIAAAVLAGGFAAEAFLAGPAQWEVLPGARRRATSQAYFIQAAPVFQHPRCLNCHTAQSFPRQGDDGHPHIMQVKRGRSDAGTAALPCSSCHQKGNSLSGVPGVEPWHLPPLRMAWEGLTIGQICRALTDPAKGGMTPRKLIEHMRTDHLVAWAWQPGPDLTGKQRSTPPISQAEFVGLIEQWAASGAACPS